MNMKRGSISRTLEVNLVVKAATKPNRMPKPIPPRPTTKNLATPRKTSTGSTTGMSATKLNMLYSTWKPVWTYVTYTRTNPSWKHTYSYLCTAFWMRARAQRALASQSEVIGWCQGLRPLITRFQIREWFIEIFTLHCLQFDNLISPSTVNDSWTERPV